MRLFQPSLTLDLVLVGLSGVAAAGEQERYKIEIAINIPHSAEINSVAFSPAGTRER